MQNALALIELTQTLTHARNEVDALLDILPGGIFRKFLNAPHGCLFDRHSQTSSSLPLSTKLTYRSDDHWKCPHGAHLLTQRYPAWASDARYVIPIAGMIIGNSMNVASVRRGGHCEPGRARSRALAPQPDGRIIGS